MSKPVLFVLTSRRDLQPSGVKTGSWLEELASSYYVLVDAGHDVTIASIDGGDAPIDPASLDAPWITDAGQRFLADGVATGKLQGSVKLATLDPGKFEAVYFIGGAGTVYDFPDCIEVVSVLRSLDGRGKPIAAVCHGVASLLNRIDGKIFASGRRVTGISDAEDVAAGYDKLLPFMPETPLRAGGAEYSAAGLFEPHVVEDNNLVTGQNPASAPLVARALLARLG